MQELDDHQLVQQYTRDGSEAAFTTLVSRHIDKVYSVALRHTGQPHQAEEITQAVFVIFAGKCRSLNRQVIISGWLYQTARLTARTFIRSEIRRAHREQEASMQTILNQPDDDIWPQIAPLLDTAIAALNDKERHAILLRFFDGKSIREVGDTLGTNEDAAQKRVNRAVEKLRQFFTKRGVVVPVAMLTATLTANSVQAAPALLTHSTTTLALAKGTSSSVVPLIKAALKTMTWTKIKTAVVAGAIILLVGTVTTVIVHPKKTGAANIAAEYPGDWIWDISNIKKVPPIMMLRPTKFPTNETSYDAIYRDRYLAHRKTAKELLLRVYSQKNSAAKFIFETDLPEDKFDCIVVAPEWYELLDVYLQIYFQLKVTYVSGENGSTVTVTKDLDNASKLAAQQKSLAPKR